MGMSWMRSWGIHCWVSGCYYYLLFIIIITNDIIIIIIIIDRNTYPTGSNSNMAYEKERMVLLSMCSTLAEGGSGQ